MKKLLLLLFFAPLLSANLLAQSGCQAYFYADSNACPTVTFFDYSYVDSLNGDYIVSYSWDFGDGNTSSSSFGTNTYSANGIYTVCLSITTNTGCTSTYCEAAYINCIGGGGNCQAMFYQDSLACPTVSFYNASTSPAGILSYYYDFGDGNYSTSANPTHTYTSNGLYLACLTITAADSCSDTFCSYVYVDCLGGGACHAMFTQDSVTACPTFNVYDNSTANSQILSYFYDFGDGYTSNAMYASHDYTANGTYQICLTITTADSCTSTYCETVVVNCIGGLEENVFANSYVSPNPAQQQLTLHLDQAQDIHFRIIGLNGAVYAQGVRPAQMVHQFELDGLSQGMYLLEIEAQGSREVLRFIRE